MNTIIPKFPDKITEKLTSSNRKAAKQWYFKIRDVIKKYVSYDDKKYIVAQLMFYIYHHTKLTVDGEYLNPNKQELGLHIASKYILGQLFK
jgi:hypothetical protein